MAASPPGSLRRRLLRWVTLSTIAIVGLSAMLSHRQALHDVQELIDALMAETAQLLLAQAVDGGGLTGVATVRSDRLGANAPRRSNLPLEVQLGRADGTVLLRTPDAPETSLKAPGGFSDIEHLGAPWRSLVTESADRAYRIQIALPHEARDDEALEIAARVVLPMVVALPLLIGLIYLSVRRGLKPLDDLAADVASRSPTNLSALAAAATPPEARPLVQALNRLLGRVEAALEGERRFTADAAHELRTPLAALKVHAQLALASNPHPVTRTALAKVIAGADRATHLVEQLLRLARLDHVDGLETGRRVDLCVVAAAAVDDARGAADRGGHTLRAELPDTAIVVAGDADLLGTALRNLVDNALRYSPAGSNVVVAVDRTDGAPAIAVADDGPGVPAEDLPRIADRFYRGSEPGAEGSGLGLAIVSRIAEIHGARLVLANCPQGGFIARIGWPATAPT